MWGLVPYFELKGKIEGQNNTVRLAPTKFTDFPPSTASTRRVGDGKDKTAAAYTAPHRVIWRSFKTRRLFAGLVSCQECVPHCTGDLDRAWRESQKQEERRVGESVQRKRRKGAGRGLTFAASICVSSCCFGKSLSRNRPAMTKRVLVDLWKNEFQYT